MDDVLSFEENRRDIMLLEERFEEKLNEGLNKGIAQGIEQGVEKEHIAIISNLAKDYFSSNQNASVQDFMVAYKCIIKESDRKIVEECFNVVRRR